jgi:hypothetical protein
MAACIDELAWREALDKALLPALNVPGKWPAKPEQRLRAGRQHAHRLRQFAEHQPYTPVIETVRGLLAGTPIGAGNGIAAVAWSAGIAVASYLWAGTCIHRSAR